VVNTLSVSINPLSLLAVAKLVTSGDGLLQLVILREVVSLSHYSLILLLRGDIGRVGRYTDRRILS